MVATGPKAGVLGHQVLAFLAELDNVAGCVIQDRSVFTLRDLSLLALIALVYQLETNLTTNALAVGTVNGTEALASESNKRRRGM